MEQLLNWGGLWTVFCCNFMQLLLLLSMFLLWVDYLCKQGLYFTSCKGLALHKSICQCMKIIIVWVQNSFCIDIVYNYFPAKALPLSQIIKPLITADSRLRVDSRFVNRICTISIHGHKGMTIFILKTCSFSTC